MNKVLKLALPMILANLTVPFIGAVDTAFMGHLDNAIYLAATGIGVMIFDFLYWGFGFLRMGTTGLAAQAHGAHDITEQRLILYRNLFLSLLIGIIIISLQIPIAKISFYSVHAKADLTVEAKNYFHARIWGAPAVLANYVFLGWLIGRTQARLALLLTAFTNILAALLDYYFVIKLGMTTAGIAWAAVIAQYAGALFALVLCYKQLDKNQPLINLKQLLQKDKLQQLFSLNRDIFLRTLALILVFAFFTRTGAQYGRIVLAANVVLLNFQEIMAYALDGFANAAEALVGNAIGTGKKAVLREALTSTVLWSLLVAVLFCLVYLLFGQALLNLFTKISLVLQTAQQYLFYSIIMPLVAVWCFWLDGVFIGATRSYDMRNSMLLAAIGFFALFYLLDSISNLGNHALWIALTSFMLLRSFSMSYLLSRKPLLAQDE